MAYSSPFVYTRVLGTLGNNAAGVEQWGVGFKIPHAGTGITPSELMAFLTGISDDVQTFHTNTTLGAGAQTYLKQLTAAVIGTDGKYLGGGTQTTQIYNYTTPVPGAGTNVSPYSTAIVLSLRTQFARGPASNGRIYWPAISATFLNTTGMMTSAATQTIANAAKALLDGVNAQFASTFSSSNRVSVMSQVGNGTLAPVTSVRVDGRPDRQERRERNLVSTYSSASLASAAALIEEWGDTPIVDARGVQQLR